MHLLILAALAVGCVFVLIAIAAPYARRRRDVAEAIAAWNAASSDARLAVLSQRCAADPRSAANWYLLGCAHLRRDDIAAAARYFGKAYHADWRLESAALMTFACLKASAARGGLVALREHTRVTWGEMGRPALGRRRGEHRLLAGLGAHNGRDGVTADELGRILLA